MKSRQASPSKSVVPLINESGVATRSLVNAGEGLVCLASMTCSRAQKIGAYHSDCITGIFGLVSCLDRFWGRGIRSGSSNGVRADLQAVALQTRPVVLGAVEDGVKGFCA